MAQPTRHLPSQKMLELAKALRKLQKHQSSLKRIGFLWKKKKKTLGVQWKSLRMSMQRNEDHGGGAHLAGEEKAKKNLGPKDEEGKMFCVID